MFINGFPDELKNDASKVISLIPHRTYNNVSVGTTEQYNNYFLNGSLVTFPDRMYFIDVTDDVYSKLDFKQIMILHCIYSRNCDGYVRQKHIKSLLLMDYKDWAIPYIVKVCDEYVIEILEIVYAMLKEHDAQLFKRFCKDNAQSFRKSYARMISYWNEYYRYKYNQLQEYVGKKLFIECFGYTRAFETKKKGKLQTSLVCA
jgi:hypothetical protein